MLSLNKNKEKHYRINRNILKQGRKVKNRKSPGRIIKLIFIAIAIFAVSCTGIAAAIPTDIPTAGPTATAEPTSTPAPTEIPDGIYVPITTEAKAYVDKLYCKYSKYNHLPDNWNSTWAESGFTLIYGNRPLSEVPLEDYALVILAIPHTDEREFTQEDVDAILDYVDKGGQLFLISKYYSDGYGNSTEMANLISSKFDVKFINEILEASNKGIVSYPVIQHPITNNIDYWVVRHQPCKLEVLDFDGQTLLKNVYGDKLLALINYGHGRAIFLAEIEGLEYNDILLRNLTNWFNPNNID